jgi:membrane protein
MNVTGPNVVSRAVTNVDETQRRRPWLAFPYAVVKKFGEDKGGYLASLIAYYGFFSLFPLLLVLVTVLGYVLAGNPDLQGDIVDSTLTQFPILGPDIRENVGEIDGNLFALLIGIAATLWAGLGAIQAMEHAMDTVWCVPAKQRPNFVVAKLRALVMLPIIGGGFLGVALLGGTGTAGSNLGMLVAFIGAALGAALATGMFLVGFRVMTNRDLPWQAHLPGAILAGVLFIALQLVGGLYVEHVVKGASQTYGVFAVVIGLLSWMALQAQFAVVAAEVNVVRHEHLWPRALAEDDGDDGATACERIDDDRPAAQAR